jgi:hypothetical protein
VKKLRVFIDHLSSRLARIVLASYTQFGDRVKTAKSDMNYKVALAMLACVAIGALAMLGIGWLTSTEWIKGIKPEWITGIATIVLGIATIFLVMVTRDLAQTTATAFNSESRHNRFALALDLLLKMDDRFNAMRASRQKAATYWKDKEAGKNVPVARSAYLDDVLDFFDLLGYFRKLGALERLPVWNMFYHHAHHWYSTAEEYITSQRQKDHTIWENFYDLDRELVGEQMRQRNCKDIDPSIKLGKEDLLLFLNNESGV